MTYCYKNKDTYITEFSTSENAGAPETLFGMQCDTKGLWFKLMIDRDAVDSRSFDIVDFNISEDGIRTIWHTADKNIEVVTNWRFCSMTGVWTRQDTLGNIGCEQFSINRYFSGFAFIPGEYSIYSQRSSWCNENQGNWMFLNHGSHVIESEGGRTAQGAAPFMVIKPEGSAHGTAFHLLPRGDWKISARALTGPGDSRPYAIIEAGMSDEDMDMSLEPGRMIEMPLICINQVSATDRFQGTERLHRFLLKNIFKGHKYEAPLVYNTWFENFDHIDPDKMIKELSAAKELGCEIFAIDAGWYGCQSGSWSKQTGDWREKVDGAFKGRMEDFADRVREAGLGFGLWIEFERIGSLAPVLKERPEWFIRADDQHHYPDLHQPQVYGYLYEQIVTLCERYQLKWIKIDFNFKLSKDPYKEGFKGYYEKLYELLDELRGRFPGTFFEGCASGGMRLDISTLSHFDGHFLSDNVNPYDLLRIYQGGILRLLPGRLTRWLVIRSAGKAVPVYGHTLEGSPESILAPGGATWEGSVKVDPEFALLAAMPGMLGISGDLSSLPDDVMQKLRDLIGFYKEKRAVIARSYAFLLTPVKSIKDNGGWTAVQLKDPVTETSLVFVYRLNDVNSRIKIIPEEIDGNKEYILGFYGRKEILLSGHDIIQKGIDVQIDNINRAVVLTVIPKT